MDFDDLLFRCVNLFELFEEVRDRYRRGFRHVLVDEYQDTNRAQYRWLQLLARSTATSRSSATTTSRSTRFRGADIRNILDFEDDFPDAEVVKLEQNYRSTADDPDASQRGDRQQPRAQGQDALERSSARATPCTCASSRTSTPRRASWSSEIERLVDEGGSRDDFAVFYRTNAQSRVLEDMLVRYGVAYQVIGGTRFYERAEIKDALAYLTLLVNPSDTVAFERVVNSPRRGIGQTLAGAARSGTRTRSASRSGRWPPRPRRCPASARPRSRPWAASCR